MTEVKKDDFVSEDQMTPEQQKEITESEDFVLRFKSEDYEDPDKVEELKKHQERLKTTIHQKRHYRTKFQEATKKNNETDPEVPPTKPGEKKPKDDVVVENSNAIIEFRQDHPELSKAIVKEIFDHATVKKITAEEAFKLPLIQRLIKDSQSKDDVEDASVTPVRKAGSGIEKKNWDNASESEIIAERNKMMGGGGI